MFTFLFTSATTETTDHPITCSKCGTTNNFGKLSCCTRGGAWFKNCGDPGDSNFGHTWSEGVAACESKHTIHWVDKLTDD